METASSTYAAPRKGRGKGKTKGKRSSTPSGTPSPAKKLRLDPTAGPTTAINSDGHEVANGDAGPSTPRRARTASTPRTPSLRRAPPKASQVHPQHAYTRYRELVEFRAAQVFRIDERTWVAELHDDQTGEIHRGVHAWTVLQRHVHLVGKPTHSCAPCADFAVHGTCVHVMLLESIDAPELKVLSEVDNPECIPISFNPAEGDEPAYYTFVCMSARDPPVFVSHYGANHRAGVWACSKDRGGGCAHVARAQKTMAAMLAEDEDPEDLDGEVRTNADRAIDQQRKVEERAAKNVRAERSVSHLAVGPPAWCRLPSDTAPWFALVSPLPAVLPIGPSPRCRCGSGPKHGSPVKRIACTIYGSRSAENVLIEVQPCAEEERQWAGPDLRELGLFNYNNSHVYTHELLNKFTSSFSAHELPFHAYATVTQRSYTENACSIKFIDDDTFRTAWYSFSQVQDLGDSFQCEKCGRNPSVVLFDGVTVAYHVKHRTSTLTPPTTILPAAPQRSSVSGPPENTSAVWGQVRLRAQKAVRWRLGLTSSNKSKLDGITADADEASARPVPDADTQAEKAARETNSRISKRDAADLAMRSSLAGIARELTSANASVGSMFKAMVPTNYDAKEAQRRPYLELLDHVLAYESVLLFAPQPTWLALRRLCADDGRAADVLLREVPAIGVVARQEMQADKQYSSVLKGVVAFILERAMRVLSSLGEHELEPARQIGDDSDWRQTGTFYGRPQVRVRPGYPRLPGDQKVDRSVVTESGAGGIGCSKYYETYGERGKTGGLMAAWCPHSVCLGFHCIPKGEGRNDVFSVLVTRWETAPEIVIYDFACALGPYCMLREPKFFARTRFLIDGFHEKGHTRCSRACMISTFKKNTPSLRAVNSSAAECGNGGLLKIRRPLGYMTQRHAIVFAYTYLACWNRDRRLGAQRKSRN